MLAVVIGILAIAAVLGISYLAVAGILWLVCLGFGLEWSWLLSLGVWALLILIKGGLSINFNSK